MPKEHVPVFAVFPNGSPLHYLTFYRIPEPSVKFASCARLDHEAEEKAKSELGIK